MPSTGSGCSEPAGTERPAIIYISSNIHFYTVHSLLCVGSRGHVLRWIAARLSLITAYINLTCYIASHVSSQHLFVRVDFGKRKTQGQMVWVVVVGGLGRVHPRLQRTARSLRCVRPLIRDRRGHYPECFFVWRYKLILRVNRPFTQCFLVFSLSSHTIQYQHHVCFTYHRAGLFEIICRGNYSTGTPVTFPTADP